MECSINSPALLLLMKHLVIGQRLKTPNFSAFHWSPRGSLVFIGQHFVATRVVHLPKSTETRLIAESDQSGPNHQLLQLCMASTAWSDSNQAVLAVHSCNSWLSTFNRRCKPVHYRYFCLFFFSVHYFSSPSFSFTFCPITKKKIKKKTLQLTLVMSKTDLAKNTLTSNKF